MRAVKLAWPLATLAACAEPPPPLLHRVRIAVEDDVGRPVEGARISAGERPAGVTGPDGTLLLEVQAPEGTRLPIDLACPEGHAPAPPAPVALRRHQRLDARADDAALVSLTCRRLEHEVVVALRARGAAGLPVLLMGREIARTDAAGAAHVGLAMSPGVPFRLTIDTSSEPALRPVSPSVTFVMPEREDVLLWDQPFERLQPPRRRRKKAPPPPAPERPSPILSSSRSR